MCGIVGFVGHREAAEFLLSGLSKLEYRGYDSAGIAIFSDHVHTIKTKGRLADLRAKVEAEGGVSGCLGIGHTRWATHGAPNDLNSHPHSSMSGRITVVHNGIIENYLELRAELEDAGIQFVSDTDTEVVSQLLDFYYDDCGKDMVETLKKVIARLRGSYALGILCTDYPNQLVAVRKDSPLIIGLGDGENYIASDIPAVLESTSDYYLLNDNEIAVLTAETVTILDAKTYQPITREIYHVIWDISAAEKGGYDYFMMKEIHEQPEALRNCVGSRLTDHGIHLDDISFTEEQMKQLNRIHIVACGSAWHAGIVGKYVIEELARVPVEVDLASEFRYRNPILAPNDLCILISQSGETADTMAALREAKRNGIHTLAIVNAVGSSLARESDDVLYTMAGPEIAVATTKGYMTQLGVLYLIGLHFGAIRGTLSADTEKALSKALYALPDQIRTLIEQDATYREIAAAHASKEHAFVIGRGIDYAASLEGSLKMKEISYIHSEAYAAGELKHGTISLIEQDTLVIAVATQDALYEKLLSNAKEVKARGAYVIAIVKEGNTSIEAVADKVIYIPASNDLLTAALTVVPMQLIAYYIAIERGCDVDKPRNLAKSVTVE